MARPRSADLLAYPIHIGTHGVVDRNSNGNPLGMATLGEVVDEARPIRERQLPHVLPNNTGMVRIDPRSEFYVRENELDPLYGPLTFADANSYARHLSSLPERSGYAELITYVGERGGDPQLETPVLFVVFTYVRGRRTLGGPMP